MCLGIREIITVPNHLSLCLLIKLIHVIYGKLTFWS